MKYTLRRIIFPDTGYMNGLKIERTIGRTRYVFVFFFLAAGFSAMKSGSVPAVYLSIFAATSAYLILAPANQRS